MGSRLVSLAKLRASEWDVDEGKSRKVRFARFGQSCDKNAHLGLQSELYDCSSGPVTVGNMTKHFPVNRLSDVTENPLGIGELPLRSWLANSV